MKIKHSAVLLSVLLGLWLSTLSIHAVIIRQTSDARFVAWEGENVDSIVNGNPSGTAIWVVKADATGSEGSALYQQGPNQQTDYPQSFAFYKIQFKTPGTYNLYVRWRADKARSDQDANGANSYKVPISFGDLSTDTTSLNYVTSSANNSRTPPDANNYISIKEAQTFEVTQGDVDAGVPLILKVGTREWGMFVDRFVVSLDSDLTDTAFNGLPNSPTSLVVQGASDPFVAWQGENVDSVVNGVPSGTATWVVKADATGSEGSALYQQGPNQQTDYPQSFAFYKIQFKTPGTYNLYVRWRADKARSDQDANGANSYKVPISFGDLSTDTTSLNYVTSSANNSRTPPDANNYVSIKEAQTFEVTQGDVDAAAPLILKVGTREWGMFLDRFIFHQRSDLSDAEFNALPDSGASARPLIKKATGSETLTSVRVTFDRAIKPDSVDPNQFKLDHGGSVSAAAADLADPTVVILTTGLQTQNTKYILTVSGVTDVSGNPITPLSPVSFTSWKLAPGWVRKQIYFGTGTTVAELLANPKYPDHPDTDEFVRSVSMVDDPYADNYGGRFIGYFAPSEASAYEFYIVGDDEAVLYLSSDSTPAQLADVLHSSPGLTAFDPSAVYTSGTLVPGTQYLFQLLFQEGTGTSRAALAVRKAGSSGDPASLTPLSGAEVTAFVNPDAGAIAFKRQPSNTTAGANARATFSVAATSVSGGVPFYQWQREGIDIVGANRATYVTPPLSAADDGKKFRVVVSVNGSSSNSAAATLTVGPAVTLNQSPYIGVNFVGGGTNPGGELTPFDVAGVAPQDHYNNLSGGTFADAALSDASGAPTPVTLTIAEGTPVGAGTGLDSGDNALFQGYVHNANTPLTIQLSNVPNGNYNLIVYSVGFNFNTTYEQSLSLAGKDTYPVYSELAQHAGEYVANPVFVEMKSVAPAPRDHGNYTVFRNVSPAGDGTLALTVTPENPGTPGIAYLPAVNGLQLTRPIATSPNLAVGKTGSTLTINWFSDAAGYHLESSSALATGAPWSPVSGAPNPIATTGSINIQIPASGNSFYRLVK